MDVNVAAAVAFGTGSADPTAAKTQGASAKIQPIEVKAPPVVVSSDDAVEDSGSTNISTDKVNPGDANAARQAPVNASDGTDSRNREEEARRKQQEQAEKERAREREREKQLETLIGAKLKLAIKFDDELDRFIIQGVDKSTGKVVEQYPPKQFIEQVKMFREIAGLTLDKTL